MAMTTRPSTANRRKPCIEGAAEGSVLTRVRRDRAEARGSTGESREYSAFSDPYPRVSKQPQPRCVFGPRARSPGMLHAPEDTLGVRHEQRDAPVAVAQPRDAARG